MIYQELSLAPHLTVEENILLGMEPVRFGLLRRGEIRRRTEAALRQLGHPEVHPEARVGRLAPASQQVVEIARSLVFGCRVLVLDEPTSSLSRDDTRRLFGLIRELRGQGYAVVYISHFLEEVQQAADRFTVLRDGRAVGGGLTRSAALEDIIRLMVGQRVESLYPRSERRRGEPLLELRDLAGRQRPASASLALHRGEVVGVAGLVGAGRTEFLRAIFGLDPVRCGEIRFAACLGPASPAHRWRQGMGMLSEDRKNEGLALGLNVADNLTLSRLDGFGPWGLIRPSRQRDAADRWISQLHIRCRSPRQPAAELSGGNQQRLALARLLYHDVDALLLDEPTRGIDVGSKAQIYALIDELVSGRAFGTRPKAVLMVSSYLPELLGICDRIAVMCRGRLGPARPTAEWTEETLIAEAAGVAAGDGEG
jgi:ribose transport system ATP-binding protein